MPRVIRLSTLCRSRSPLPSFILIAEEVDGVLVEVLAPVVVPHHGLRVFVLRHHLHLPVGQAGVERPGDGSPPQVVRGKVAEPRVVRPSLDDLMAGLTERQCNAIAYKLNMRPRKRLGFRTPLECFKES